MSTAGVEDGGSVCSSEASSDVAVGCCSVVDGLPGVGDGCAGVVDRSLVGAGSAEGRKVMVGCAVRVTPTPDSGMKAFGGSRGSDRSTMTRFVPGVRASTGPSRGSVAGGETGATCVCDAVVGSGSAASGVVVAEPRAVVAKVGAGAVERQTPKPIAVAVRQPMAAKVRVFPISRLIAFSSENLSIARRTRSVAGWKPQVAAL
ncbi:MULTISPECIES: hypothetical protein [unclassified Corynebacterium]|uniref:hypothetical protein n=1 Tax=unclassified Corynebacterium TaxID=2624378 RepID=UPI003525D0BC